MRTYLIRAVLALAVVLAVSGPAAAQSVVRGKVVDGAGKPVEGAVVTIEATEANRKAQTKTNRNGEFLQVGLASGRYNVTVTKDNLKQVQPATVSQGNPVELSFQLTPTSGLTPEQVKANQEMQVLAQGAIEAMRERTSVSRSAITGYCGSCCTKTFTSAAFGPFGSTFRYASNACRAAGICPRFRFAIPS